MTELTEALALNTTLEEPLRIPPRKKSGYPRAAATSVISLDTFTRLWYDLLINCSERRGRAVSSSQPFAPDAVRILKRALAIAAKAGAPRLAFEHLYCATVEELGTARLRLLRVPDGLPEALRGLAGSAMAGDVRSSRLSRDVRCIVDRAIRIASTRVGPSRDITGDDSVLAMKKHYRRRGTG